MNNSRMKPNSDDYEKITRAIGLYATGWQNNIEHFLEAFEEDAWIFYTDASGRLSKALLNDCFKGWASTNWVIEPDILSFTQTGNIASVMLKFNNKTAPSASFVDNLTLIKLGKVWKITNKTAIHQSNSGELVSYVSS